MPRPQLQTEEKSAIGIVANWGKMGDAPSKDQLVCPTSATTFETQSVLTSHISQCNVVIKSEPPDLEEDSYTHGQDATTSRNAERRQRIIDCANRETSRSVSDNDLPVIKTEPVTDHEQPTLNISVKRDNSLGSSSQTQGTVTSTVSSCGQSSSTEPNMLQPVLTTGVMPVHGRRRRRGQGRKWTFKQVHSTSLAKATPCVTTSSSTSYDKQTKKKPPQVNSPFPVVPRQSIPMAGPVPLAPLCSQPLQTAQSGAVLNNFPQLITPMGNMGLNFSNPLLQQMPNQNSVFSMNPATGNLQLGSVPSVLPLPQVNPVNANRAVGPPLVPNSGLPIMPQVNTSTATKTDPNRAFIPVLLGNQVVLIPSMNPGTVLPTLPLNQSTPPISISSVSSLIVSQAATALGGSSSSIPVSTMDSRLKSTILGAGNQNVSVPQSQSVINLISPNSTEMRKRAPQTTQSISSPLMTSNEIDSKQIEKGTTRKLPVSSCPEKDQLCTHTVASYCRPTGTKSSCKIQPPTTSTSSGQTDHISEKQTTPQSSKTLRHTNQKCREKSTVVVVESNTNHQDERTPSANQGNEEEITSKGTQQADSLSKPGSTDKMNTSIVSDNVRDQNESVKTRSRNEPISCKEHCSTVKKDLSSSDSALPVCKTSLGMDMDILANKNSVSTVGYQNGTSVRVERSNSESYPKKKMEDRCAEISILCVSKDTTSIDLAHCSSKRGGETRDTFKTCSKKDQSVENSSTDAENCAKKSETPISVDPNVLLPSFNKNTGTRKRRRSRKRACRPTTYLGRARLKNLPYIKPRGKLMMTSTPNSNLTSPPKTNLSDPFRSTLTTGTFLVQPNASTHLTSSTSVASQNPITFVLPNQVNSVLSNFGGAQNQGIVQSQMFFPQQGAQPMLANSSFTLPYQAQNPLNFASAQNQMVLPSGVTGIGQTFPPQTPGILLDNAGGQNVLIQNITNNQPILIGANPSHQTAFQGSPKNDGDSLTRCTPVTKTKTKLPQKRSNIFTKPISSQALVRIKPKPTPSKLETKRSSDPVIVKSEPVEDDEADNKLPVTFSVSKGASPENSAQTNKSVEENEVAGGKQFSSSEEKRDDEKMVKGSSSTTQLLQNLMNNYDFSTSLLRKGVCDPKKHGTSCVSVVNTSTSNSHESIDPAPSKSKKSSNLYWGPLSQEQLQKILKNPDGLQELVGLNGSQVLVTSKALTVQTTLCNPQPLSLYQTLTATSTSGQSLMMASSLPKQPVMTTSMSGQPSSSQMASVSHPMPSLMVLPPLRKFSEGPRPPELVLPQAMKMASPSDILSQLPKLAPKPGLNDPPETCESSHSISDTGTEERRELATNTVTDNIPKQKVKKRKYMSEKQKKKCETAQSDQAKNCQLKFYGDIEMLATALKPCRIYMDKLPDTTLSRFTRQQQRKRNCTESVSAPSTSGQISAVDGRTRGKRSRRGKSLCIDPEWCVRSEDQAVVPGEGECHWVPMEVVGDLAVRGQLTLSMEKESGRGMRRSGRIRDKPRLDYADLEQKPFKDLDDEEEREADKEEGGEEEPETKFEIVTEYAVEEGDEEIVLEPMTHTNMEETIKCEAFSAETNSGAERPLVIDESWVSDVSGSSVSFLNVSERSPPTLSPANCHDTLLKVGEGGESLSDPPPVLYQAQTSTFTKMATNSEQEMYYSSESESDMLGDPTEDCEGNQKLKSVMKMHNQVTKFLVKHAAKFTSNEDTDDHFCNICGFYKTNGIFSLSKHLKKHLSGVLKCPSCVYEACHEKALSDHKLSVHCTQ